MRFFRNRGILAFLLVVLLLVAGGRCGFSGGGDEEIRWDMVNVNQDIQGDAHVLSGSSSTVLIDTGHKRVAESVLLPYLRARQIGHIDAAIITHAHNDHYGGLMALLNDSSIEIGRIYMTRPSEAWVKREHWGVAAEELDAIEEKIRSRKIPMLPVQAFDAIRIGGDFYLRKMAAPTEGDLIALNVKPDINDLSLIAMLTNEKLKVLFTGDLNKSFSEYLLRQWKADVLKVDILKFPHHAMEGFASSDFIRATQAKVFLNPMPIQFLTDPRGERARQIAKDMNVQVYTNGQHGHVTVRLRGADYRIETER